MLRLATRTSDLALTQSRLVAEAMCRHVPTLKIEFLPITSTGDALPDDPLTGFSQQGVFTRELDRAVLDGRADFAVHSLKDLPTTLQNGLVIAAIPKRANPVDTLVKSREESYSRRLVGTSSPRRRAQLLASDPGILPVDLRGNVPTRLKKLESGDYGAIVLARAGLDRLGLAPNDAEDLSADVMLPAPGQGALAIVIRADRDDLAELLRPLHDPITAACVQCERRVLSLLGGGCHAAVATLAQVLEPETRDAPRMKLRARHLWLNGHQSREVIVEGLASEWERLAEEAALHLRGLPDVRELDGVRVAVTRDEAPSGSLCTALRELGAIPFCIPLTRTLPASDPSHLQEAAGRLTTYDWLLITSQRALPFVEGLFGEGERRANNCPRIACVGEQTAAAMRSIGIEPTVVADEENSASLSASIAAKHDLQGARILYPASSLTDDSLPEALREAGAHVDVVEAYRTEADNQNVDLLGEFLQRRQIDMILVASPFAARLVSGVLRALPDVRPLIGSIGPTTSAELARLGSPAAFESPERSFQSLAKSATNAWTNRQNR